MKVKIELTENLLGTIPKDKELYSSFIATKTTVENESEELESVKEIEEKGWTGFHSDDKGLFVYDYFIKGFLKNAANILKEELGVRALKSKINDFVFVQPRKVYLGKKEPDGFLERPIRGWTPSGYITSLVRSDFVSAGTKIVFDIFILKHKEIDENLIKELLKYGALQGLGQWRNAGYGRFKVIEDNL